MTAVLAAVAGVLGLFVGVAINRSAGRYPWPPRKRSWSRGPDTPAQPGVSAPQLHDRGTTVGTAAGSGQAAVRRPVVELGTAAIFALVALRFGASAELPAFLWLAGSGVLLAVIDLQHRLLPNRVIGPSVLAGAALLLVAAWAASDWAALARALSGGGVLFAVFLVLALISPSGLGMGDVKLAGFLGLYLGWLGWGAVVVGAAAGFVIQAALALALLAGRRIGLRGELPFGPAMLAGAALAVGWGGALLG
jgi:leader peptidase (prepilin peptidase)/N-methyltransferase